jgi:hypothetical protein
VRTLRKLRLFCSFASTERSLILEAIVMLGVARVVVVIMPFRWIAAWLERAPKSDGHNDALVSRVRRAVVIAARNVPWNAVCLPQAMAAKIVLARHGCGSALHLGANFNGQGKLVAHAWLVSGGEIVVGAAGADSVMPLARFG